MERTNLLRSDVRFVGGEKVDSTAGSNRISHLANNCAGIHDDSADYFKG
jgi:hypothetical protein